MSFQYPPPPSTGSVTETTHGVTIHDPHRALEDDESEVTKSFIRAQNELSLPYLQSHPRRKHMHDAVAANYDYDKMTCPERQADGWYYWQFNDGTLARDVVVRSRDLDSHYGKGPSALGGPDLMFDPSAEEHTSLYWQSWSPSGRFTNLILQKSGSDWQSIRTLDTHTMDPVNDDLTQSKFTFGGCWIGDSGFLYKKEIGISDGTADGQFGAYFHRLGTSQTDDVLVWSGENPSQFVNHPLVCSVDANPGSGRRAWLVCDMYRNTDQEAENFMIELPEDLSAPGLGVEIARRIKDQKKWLCRGFSGTMRYIGTLPSDNHLFLSTYNGCSTGCVVSLRAQDWDSTDPGAELPTSVLVPKHPEGLTLSSATLVGNRALVLVYLRDACAHVVYVDALTGESIAAPTQGIPPNSSVSTVTSAKDSNEFFLAVESFLGPPVTFRGQLQTDPASTIVIDRLGAATTLNDDLVTRQVMYTSHDGTRIPIFLCHAGDLDTSKAQPLLLHAYGGFQVANVPQYATFWLSFVRQTGGIVAIACIRGGGEYGKDWHEAAKGIKRSVAWDDFGAAARYLHAEGLSTPGLTSIYGTSNGGLLVAASVNRNPELFSVVLCDVGVLDLVRFHKFTMGRLWVSEYGDPDSADHLPILASTSPVHNVHPDASTYPAILVTTADHDTRVIPGHSLKYLAALQATKAANSGGVFLGRIYENTGHAADAKSKDQMVEELVDRLVFVLNNIDSQ